LVFSFFTRGFLPQSDSPRSEEVSASSSSKEHAAKLSYANSVDPARLDGLNFRYPFRKYQKEIIELVKIKLERGEKQLHIVAPPGAGKTIIGLQLITELKKPALVICPTTTIQSQWAQKLDLFAPAELQGLPLTDLIGTHEDKPLKPITLLTYQVISTPGREMEYLNKLAHDSWITELCKTDSSTLSQGDAELRIMELMQNNRKAYSREMRRHISRLRRQLTELIDMKEVLHSNAIALMQAFRRQDFGVVIFDECHHLTDYWAAVMTHIVKKLNDPIIIGLTGTPPEGKSASQETRYLSLVGDIDYQVPTPALVREGGLAPFQDLVMFTEPTDREEQFLADQHEEFHALLDDLVASNPPLLVQWLVDRLEESTTEAKTSPLNKRNDLSTALVRFAWKYKVKLPAGIDLSDNLRQAPLIDDWMLILEDFALNRLKVSPDAEHHKIYDRIRSAVGKLGFGLTERGLRKQASPVDRVLAFSQSKPEAVARILSTEYRSLEDRLRAAVVTDFEKMSALRVKSAKGVLSPDSGGAVGVLRHLVKTEIGALLNPCMVTGSLLLVDRRIAEQFVSAAQQYLRAEGYKFNLEIKERISYSLPSDEHVQRTKYSADDSSTAADSSIDKDQDEEDQDEQHDEEQDREDAIDEDFDVVTTTQEPQTKNTVVKKPQTPAPEPRKKASKKLQVADAASDVTTYSGSITPVPQVSEAIKHMELSTELIPIHEPFVEITASSAYWEARLYVGMATALLERGITKCLIGTRGLFGEGWDCQSLNTLIDLTTTTTPVSVKQLRGRSLRLNVHDPLGSRKVANNWDVVCVAPHLEKGLNDYQRFVRKHDGYFGISDDGQIECGVGHVHAAFSELTAAEVFSQYADFNDEMANRALVRDQIYDLWKVGEPYHNKLLGCIEVSSIRKLALTPPNIRRDQTYKEHAAMMRSSLNGLWLEYGGLSATLSGFLGLALAHWGLPLFVAALPLLPAMVLGRAKYVSLYERLKAECCRPNTQESSLMDMSVAVLSALQQLKFLPRYIQKEAIKISVRSDGSYRVFLDDAEPAHSEYFAKSIRELLAPITNQPYLLPKYEFYFPREKKRNKRDNAETAVITANSNESYGSEEAFFAAYLRGKAQPRVAAYHAIPSLLARSEKGREAFMSAWNKYVSAGYIVETETNPDLLNKYFGIGPSLAQRLLWE
jgi:superfamily II DNA or RNA helicase